MQLLKSFFNFFLKRWRLNFCGFWIPETHNAYVSTQRGSCVFSPFTLIIHLLTLMCENDTLDSAFGLRWWGILYFVLLFLILLLCHYHDYLQHRKSMEVMFSLLSVFVCLSVSRLSQKKFWTDSDAIWWTGSVCDKDEIINFWWRSGN